MRVDRRNEMLFLSLQDEARGLEIEEAKGCYCIECLVIVIETFWARKCNIAKLDFIEKLKEISNKLHKYIIDIKPKEHEKFLMLKLLLLDNELEDKKIDILKLEKIKLEVQKNIDLLESREKEKKTLYKNRN